MEECAQLVMAGSNRGGVWGHFEGTYEFTRGWYQGEDYKGEE